MTGSPARQTTPPRARHSLRWRAQPGSTGDGQCLSADFGAGQPTLFRSAAASKPVPIPAALSSRQQALAFIISRPGAHHHQALAPGYPRGWPAGVAEDGADVPAWAAPPRAYSSANRRKMAGGWVTLLR